MIPLLYFDNAATSNPKPGSVVRAVSSTLAGAYGNPGRSLHPAAERAADLLFRTRARIARHFALPIERVVFTGGATAALNAAIYGLRLRDCEILLSDREHNAVSRTAAQLAPRGVRIRIFHVDPENEDNTLRSFLASLTWEVKAVVSTAASNVDGTVLPYRAMAEECKKRQLPLILDCAQLGGHRPFSMEEVPCSAAVFAGHKGLLAPQGVGLILLGEDARRLEPSVFGGNGVDSVSESMGNTLPERFEAGTLPLPAIAGLGTGIGEIERIGYRQIEQTEDARKEELLSVLSRDGGQIYTSSDGVAVVSYRPRDKSPEDFARVLGDYGVCVRAGLHCAPYAHRALGTLSGGTVRFSLSHANTRGEIERLDRILTALRRH